MTSNEPTSSVEPPEALNAIHDVPMEKRGEGLMATEQRTVYPETDQHPYKMQYDVKPWAMLIIACTFVFLIWVLSWVLGVVFIPNWSDRGLFGSMFGAVNTLFSGLAFAALIVNLILQRKELAIQVQNLIRTSDEMKASNKAQRISATAVQKQVVLQNQSSRLQAMTALLEEYKSLQEIFEGKDIEEMEYAETGRTFYQSRERLRQSIEKMLEGLADQAVDDQDQEADDVDAEEKT
ncbi:MAG TPA: hypothetical protein VN688_19420 [Gemmataceae bacterium]|nr:hypothetical protein [Gemmataceae bacterium]